MLIGWCRCRVPLVTLQKLDDDEDSVCPVDVWPMVNLSDYKLVPIL